MTDFLRSIFPYLYVLIPFLIGVSLIYWVLIKTLPESKSVIKMIYRFVSLFAIAIFIFAVIRMAAVNEIPENDLNKSIKKDRQNEMIERSKQDTITTIK